MENIRNFVIISHIDHGKSTLADRFLEMTNSISKEKLTAQFLDSMDLEKEKGITIKMHPVRLIWQAQSQPLCHPEASSNEPKDPMQPRDPSAGASGRPLVPSGSSLYIMNLIDTPGHVDFSYEISRALACVEGAVLLVDAVKGVQAQTLFNLEQAQKQNLKIIGAINKIDLPQANVPEVKKELALILGIPEEEVLEISGKKGINVEKLLERIIQEIPAPKIIQEQPLKALVFDSKYDSFSGVIAYIRVFEGSIKKGDNCFLISSKSVFQAKEVGYFLPHLKECTEIKAGEIGYIKTGIKEPLLVRVGDTVSSKNLTVALPGYKEPRLVLFLSLYTKDADLFPALKDALLKLQLNDPALKFEQESKMALGRGFRAGFLGALHAEIVLRRLQKEFDLDLVATSPQVAFKVFFKGQEKELLISSPASWPEASLIQKIEEPWAKLDIIAPNEYFSQVIKILQSFDISIKTTKVLSSQKSIIEAEAPLREVITGNFYDKLKGGTEGYASFNFESEGFREADLVKLDILIAGVREDAFSRIVPKNKAYEVGKALVEKLKDVLPQQQFTVALQAVVGGDIIARETIKALKKDVTAKLYGGDITRRKKLWEKQKRGKKELKQKGRVNIPPESFIQILKD